jgi:flagellar hook protein FlgE
MGISSALYSGVSGLNTNSQAMTVIGNNLANTNTVGFKGSRTVFSDLLSSTINGSGGTSQVGRGVNVSKVDSIFSQGTFETTESGLDVAIEGNGFFMLKEEGDDTTYYSRAGAFRFDDDGYLVNPEGFRVQGQAYGADGILVPGDPAAIQVQDVGLIQANPTTEMTLNTNLDASSVSPADEVPPVAVFDPNNPASFNYSSSTQVFDSLGNAHLVSTYFVKDPLPATNSWQWYYTVTDGLPAQGQGALAAPITFTNAGLLAGGGQDTIGPIDWGNGADPSTINITLDTTQFNSKSTVISQNQNGYAAGNLTGVTIDGEGAVSAAYSNGEVTPIANLVLGAFNNPGGLELVGSNLFTATTASGVPRIGLPGPELGKVFTNSLEQSNVDMGAEFVRMITVQRGFQANSKIITTVDELLGELINLKR